MSDDELLQDKTKLLQYCLIFNELVIWCSCVLHVPNIGGFKGRFHPQPKASQLIFRLLKIVIIAERLVLQCSLNLTNVFPCYIDVSDIWPWNDFESFCCKD